MRKTIIKELRIRHSLSQKDLAEKAGISRQTVVMLEKGTYNPSIKICFKICSVLQVGIEEIFGQD